MHTDSFVRKSFARQSYSNEGDLYITIRINFDPLFLITGRALSIANVVVIAKAETTNNLKCASR
jgi:hypothetical protein